MEGTSNRNSYDLVVELLNQASVELSGPAKVILLKQVQELIINKEPNLLDNFFDEVLGFQSDKSVDVRKFVISFLEQACKIDGDILSKIIGNLNILLYDDNVNIKKKVMLSMGSLYKTAIKWIVQVKVVTEVIEETWKYLSQMRDHIVSLLDHDNDGIRTHAVKFCEAVVMALSPRTADSEVKGDDQSIDLIPPDGEGFLKKKKLMEDGKKIFKQLMAFLGSQSITSVNLMACMTSMTNIARKRSQYMTEVVGGFESLHVNLPPTLANSQVSSVRKSLKLQMLALLKHPAAVDMISQVATLLTDLGATQAEVSKAMPKPSELAANRKRKAESEAEQQRSKKFAKTELPTLPNMADMEEDEDEGSSRRKEEPKPLSAVEITTEDIVPKLHNNNVADLVLLSMVMLPDEMPAHFQSTYTPIAAAGTPGQIKHISRLLAVQLTNVGLGKGVEEQKKKEEEEALAKAEVPATPARSAIEVVGEVTSAQTQAKPQPILPMSGTTARKAKAFDLKSVTKPQSLPSSTNLVTMCMQRIFKAEGEANKANLNAAFCKILSGLTTQFGGFLRTMLHDFILADVKNRSDLALAWIYSEYVASQGFTLAEGVTKPSETGYNDCMNGLLSRVLVKRDQPGAAHLLSRLILESPKLTPPAVDVLKSYCADEKHMYVGMHMLSELILKRPVLHKNAMLALLDFSYHDKAEVRNTSIQVVKDLYERPKLALLIDDFCGQMVNNLLATKPTHSMFPAVNVNVFAQENVQQWTEPYIKKALYLYLNILADNPSYTNQLADVYVKATSDIKRVILRLMEAPIKQLGMDSPELLHFIKNSPKGSETLITRIIHILTERHAPSSQLVTIVKDLYQERVADVRFLIPVLGGLEKSEIVAALPRLIKLSPAIVKEVFNRLLGVGGSKGQDGAMTPSELMIALHDIDPSQCDIKAIIKATTMCFQEKSLFTQEVLAVVIQQLMDHNPLPTLFMRTVIQSLATYPKLLGFVLNILQRLISKQVWKQKKIWDGFVRCCQRAKPQSFQVLLQLAPPQLKMVFETAPDLRQPLIKHISNFSVHQRAHIPKAVLAAIEQDPTADAANALKTEPQTDTSEITAKEEVKSQPLSESVSGVEVMETLPEGQLSVNEAAPGDQEETHHSADGDTPPIKMEVDDQPRAGQVKEGNQPSKSQTAEDDPAVDGVKDSTSDTVVEYSQSPASAMEVGQSASSTVEDGQSAASIIEDSQSSITKSEDSQSLAAGIEANQTGAGDEEAPTLSGDNQPADTAPEGNQDDMEGKDAQSTVKEIGDDQSAAATDEVKNQGAPSTEDTTKNPSKRGRKKTTPPTPTATRKSSRRKK